MVMRCWKKTGRMINEGRATTITENGFHPSFMRENRICAGKKQLPMDS